MSGHLLIFLKVLGHQGGHGVEDSCPLLEMNHIHLDDDPHCDAWILACSPWEYVVNLLYIHALYTHPLCACVVF